MANNHVYIQIKGKYSFAISTTKVIVTIYLSAYRLLSSKAFAFISKSGVDAFHFSSIYG